MDYIRLFSYLFVASFAVILVAIVVITTCFNNSIFKTLLFFSKDMEERTQTTIEVSDMEERTQTTIEVSDCEEQLPKYTDTNCIN